MRYRKFSLTGEVLTLFLTAGVLAAAQTPPKPRVQPSLKQNETEKGGRKPGHDRWAVKTGADADKDSVVLKPVQTTVEKLLSLPRPASLPRNESPAAFQDRRARPVETTVYAVEADVVEFRTMPDGDYRVVIQGASGKQMTLEMPHPGPEYVPPTSRFVREIQKARAQFDAKMNPPQAPRPAKAHALITGIGFFGRNYNPRIPATGNLIQLHPVLNIKWLDKPTGEFIAPPQKKKP